MNPFDTFDEILGNTTRVRILRFLTMGYAGTGRALARMAQVSQPTILGPLHELAEQGIIEKRVIGRSHSFKLNSKNILVQKGLLPLFQLERNILEELRNTLQSALQKDVVSAVLFGSLARRESTASSDWDILLLCKDIKARERIHNRLQEHAVTWTTQFSTHLDIHVMVAAEFRGRYRRGDRFAKNAYEDFIASKTINPLFGQSLSQLLS